MRAQSILSLILRAGVVTCLAVALMLAGMPGSGMPVAWAQQQKTAAPSIIRDAEVERIIRSYANPLFSAAGIPPDSVVIRVLNDPALNAFVTTGNRMFIHSGLLISTETPDQLIGVIAHETGHISGGHLARMGDEVEAATITSLLSMALGAAAGIASGRGDVGMAAMMLGQSAAMRNFFAYTRTQESAADAFAMKVLDDTNQSAQGLLEFFEKLSGQELLISARQDPYVRTHPLTTDRIEAVRAHVEGRPPPPKTPSVRQAAHDRMVAKLYAFLQPQARTFQRYPENNTSAAARYARAIAYFRRGELAKAEPLVDSLLAEQPQDAYYMELKGQMLFENGRLPASRDAYKQAVALAPDEPLIAISYAHVLVELGDASALKDAEPILNRAVTDEPTNGFAWRLLGIAYGKQGDEGHAAYAMAEYALRTGDTAQALYHAEKGLRILPDGDPVRLRLMDIRNQAEGSGRKGGPPRR